MKLKAFAGLLALLVATPFINHAHAQGADEFKLATGVQEGNYWQSGYHVLRKSNKSQVKLNVLPGKGGGDNLDRLAKGEVDGAFVQADTFIGFAAKNAVAISTFERSGVLYTEFAHLLCNRKAGVNSITDLKPGMRVAVGGEGAGARTTMELHKNLDRKRYGDVILDDRDGERGLGAVSDGKEVQCALVVTGLNSPSIKDIAAQYGDQIMLVPSIDDDVLAKAKDNRGQLVYSDTEIDANQYPRLARKNWYGGRKDVHMLGVDALFVSNLNYIQAHEAAHKAVLAAFRNAKPDIALIGRPVN